MKRWVIPVAALGVALVVAFSLQQQHASRRVGFPAPDFALRDLSGRVYRLSDFRGQVVFLNIWATWCPPCREEMPSMERLYRRFSGQDFAMLAVSVDTAGAEVVHRFAEQVGITFPILLDPEAGVAERYGVTGFPETFVIDRSGQVIHHTIGPERWDSEAVYQYFAHLLAPSSDGTADGTGEHAHGGG
jgi:cytochrome c biogenesis protein CcmG/thiol:disulfide interchange protein DsbE